MTFFCSTPEDTWRQFQLLLQRQSPFWNWNLTSIEKYDFSEKRTSVLFVSVSFIVLMLISLAWLVFYYVQRFRYIHAKDRMERKLSCQAKRALAIIPTIGITKEDEDTCAGNIFFNSHIAWFKIQMPQRFILTESQFFLLFSSFPFTILVFFSSLVGTYFTYLIVLFLVIWIWKGTIWKNFQSSKFYH